MDQRFGSGLAHLAGTRYRCSSTHQLSCAIWQCGTHTGRRPPPLRPLLPLRALQGTTSPDGCVRQFVTGSTDHNHAPWDYIKFGAGLTDVYNDLSPKHHSECQLKCRDDPLCVYFEWHSTADFAAENHCYIYTVASTIRPNLTAIADTVNDVAMFEVGAPAGCEGSVLVDRPAAARNATWGQDAACASVHVPVNPKPSACWQC